MALCFGWGVAIAAVWSVALMFANKKRGFFDFGGSKLTIALLIAFGKAMFWGTFFACMNYS